MKRIRHCSCRHLPERADQFAALFADVGLSQAHLQAVVDIVYSVPPDNRRHDRALRYVTAPDMHGHVHWTGPRPLTSGPRVQYRGKRIPAAHWLWLRAGRPDAPLARTCLDTECISPDHHDLASTPRERKLVIMHARLADFDLRHPPIVYRPKKWDHSDPTRSLCLRAGHEIKVYGDPRTRATYCRLCAHDERKRLRARAALSSYIDEHDFGSGSLHGDPRPLDSIPDGPGLLDLLLHEGGWSDEALAEFDAAEAAPAQPSTPTLADQITRMFESGEFAPCAQP